MRHPLKRELMRVSLAARAARELRGLLATRPARLDWPGGVVSFTFDDFPRSAWLAGGAVLDRFAVRGTYYAALGLAGTSGRLGPIFEPGDLAAIARQGHEIACHTFSHRDCCRAAPGEIAAEIARNAAAFAALVDGAGFANFAYPFGGVSLAAKRALAGRFASCRGTGRGINRGTVDLADLSSTSLYAGDFDPARLCGLIDEARRVGGWLIFYTHDVADDPSPFGCTPAQLAAIVGYAASHAAVLPVGAVLRAQGLAAAPAAAARRAA
ncbi:MAG TPA: polysaccharide deacetylase family protein [Stellaceae bacterium]|nr:polysaccharide deacetylase family protein [Stellaceae bacterium]